MLLLVWGLSGPLLLLLWHWHHDFLLCRGNQDGGRWGGELVGGAGVGRRVFALAAPILDDLGHGNAVTEGMKVVQGYDQVRTAAMGIDASIRGHASRIAAADMF